MTAGRIIQKIRFYDDDTGRVAVAREYSHYWTFWSIDLDRHTFANYDALEKFARFNGFSPGDVTKFKR